MTNILAEIVVHSLYDFCLCVLVKHAGRACSCNAFEISHLRISNDTYLKLRHQSNGCLTNILGVVCVLGELHSEQCNFTLFLVVWLIYPSH
jgi:hypothetical protein